MPLSCPTQDTGGRGSKHFSEKEVCSEESTLAVHSGEVSPLQLSLQPSLASQGLRVTAGLLLLLTSEVSEGGERAPNRGLVRFSQNLGLKRKHMLSITLPLA